MTKEYIRTARPTDFARIADAGAASLMDDPLMTYFGCTTPESLKSYIQFTLNSCYQAGGVIDVTCVPRLGTAAANEEGEEDEEISSVAVWLPPTKRVSAWNMYTLLRSGVISLTQNIGAQGITRMGWEYPNLTAQSWMQPGLFCMADGPQWTQADTWYLKLAFTAKRYQRQGMMSKMVRERIESNPASTFTLEATSAKAQIFFYRTFDFEIMIRNSLGAGYVNESGDPETRGSGVDIFSMIKRAADPRVSS